MLKTGFLVTGFCHVYIFGVTRAPSSGDKVKNTNVVKKKQNSVTLYDSLVEKKMASSLICGEVQSR